MRFPTGIPLIVRDVELSGPSGSVWVDMILDTGAAFTTVCWSDLKAIGYDPAITADRQEIITANGIIQAPKLNLSGIVIGTLSAQDVEIICHDIPGLAGIRGLLGLSFLKHFKVTIDYKLNYFEIV